MARNPTTAPDELPDVLDREKLAEANAASQQLSLRMQQIAEFYGEGQVYERTRVVAGIQGHAAQTAIGMLGMGKGLILLKENEPHGEFTRICHEQLGFSARTAQRMMAAALKYLSPTLAAKATSMSLLGPTKLFDLMAESDEAIEELAEGGTVAGLDLDDMAGMTSRELREALKAERAARAKDNKAKQKVIDGKESKLTDLEEQLARRNSAEPDERSAAQIDAVRSASLAADQALRLLVGEAMAAYTAPGSELAKVAASMSVEYVAQMFAELITQSGLPFDFSEMVQPDWADLSRPFKRAGEPTLVTKAGKKR